MLVDTFSFRQVPAFALTTIRKFADNVCEMKRMAARDFEDILQCIIPCFEGLLPDAHNNAIMTLLYICAYWHALAKMRMHTDTSLGLLDDTTATLGYELRHFAWVTCPSFQTRETQSEYDARKRVEARRTTQPAGTGQLSTQSMPVLAGGRRPRQFNLRTIKLHFLGYYPKSIRESGTTDSYTTQTVRSQPMWLDYRNRSLHYCQGEHEHRRVKAQWERTNGVRAGSQVVNIDARESRMHEMAHELLGIGLDIPGIASHLSDVSAPERIPPEHHHHIGNTEKNFVNLRDWQTQHSDDPIVEVRVC
ncbi:hypothetical protein BC628DRAFT_1327977 [Trametes gibbosa]|nr:hypothetical protein BC628DRAFT_1327977 [Trametes gibbosa]